MSETFDLEPGTTISHFRIESKLGEGGMGAVYSAQDLTLSRNVAIKLMSRALLSQQANPALKDTIEQRFVREARSAAAVNHPNIAQIYEANFDDNDWFIAMEYIDGKTLGYSIEQGELMSVAEVISIGMQAIAGLAHAWEQYKIIHRDIKPANIMLTKNNLVKIVDMGLAKPITEDEGDEVDTMYDMPELTMAGTPLGTPQYMAPEQAVGQTGIDFRTDMFALGVTLYEVLTGHKAFHGKTAPMVYMAQVQKQYTSISELRENVPELLQTILYRMMEPKAEDRFGSYEELMQALNQIHLGDSDAEGLRTFQQPSASLPTRIATQPGAQHDEIPQSFYATDTLIKDRYRVLKPIGRGRAGMVYHGLDTHNGLECAIKSLYPGREFPVDQMEHVKRNYQQLLEMSHRNLVQVRDIEEDATTGELFIIMELLNGCNLRQYTTRLVTEHKSLAVPGIESILTSAAHAIDSVNRAFKSLHYDIKPESLFLLEGSNTVKLLDYGILRPPDDAETPAEETLHMVPLATTEYMAPEIWRHEDPTMAADQYAFAAVVYEMLARRVPLWVHIPVRGSDDSTDDTKTVIDSHAREFFQLVTETGDIEPIEGLSRKENAALLRALSRDARDRFPGCEEFIRALGTGVGLGRGKKHLLLIAAALLLVAGALAALKPNAEPVAPSGGHPPIAKPPEDDTARSHARYEREQFERLLTQLTPKPIAQPQLPAVQEASLKASNLMKERQYEEALQAYRQLNGRLKKIEEQVIAAENRRKDAEAQANSLSKQFVDLQVELSGDTLALALMGPIGPIQSKAQEAQLAGDFEQASQHYSAGLARMREISAQVAEQRIKERDALKQRALARQVQYTKERVGLAQNPYAEGLLAAADAVRDSAASLLAKDDFQAAIDTFDKAIAELERATHKALDLRKEAEQERARQKQAAEETKAEFNQRRLAMAISDRATALLKPADDLSKDAVGALMNGDYARSRSLYVDALNLIREVEKQLDLERQQQREALHAEALKQQESYRTRRQQIAELPHTRMGLKVCDDYANRAAVMLQQADYQVAAETYQKGLRELDKLEREALEMAAREKAKRREAVDVAKQRFLELRVELAKQPDSQTLMAGADRLSGKGRDLLDADRYAEAEAAYEEALEMLVDVEQRLREVRRRESKTLRDELNEKRTALREFESAAPELQEDIVRLDVVIRMAVDAMTREDFAEAADEFKQAMKKADSLIQRARDRFSARKGHNFTVPGVAMDFVWIDSMRFWASKYEITNEQFRMFKPTHNSKKAEGVSLDGDRQPVVEVSYLDVIGFGEWLKSSASKQFALPANYEFRIPSVSEWSKLARCGKDRRFPWGDSWPAKYGNFGNQEVFPTTWRLNGYDDPYPVTAPVEESGTNEWGLYGMAGNVWEWTSDKKSDKRAVCGGAWTEITQKTLAIDVQGWAPSSERFDNIGFRLILAPVEF